MNLAQRSRGGQTFKNKRWVAGDHSTGSSSENSGRWERGGRRGSSFSIRGRGSRRGFFDASLHDVEDNHAVKTLSSYENIGRSDEVEPDDERDEEEDSYHESGSQNSGNENSEIQIQPTNEPDLPSPEEREKFYQELVKAREAERKAAIAEGKMDDPLIPKRLEDAITLIGTCMFMAPRFERWRRERENNLFEWETIPGTKRVDHDKAVKMYERAAGDKTLPSDLRPPIILRKTLDYLFHDLLPQNGFAPTFNFIRDRSRAVRNDFTMQHEHGALAMACHDRCARFHILALHFMRAKKDFSIQLEEQQLMNTLQSLKEFYEDQRGKYESPNELEMRVYHRLIHIRDQRERHEDVPQHILDNPVFKLTTRFRLHVQQKSAPISKISPLVVDSDGMSIFGELAAVLRDQGNVVMIYLVGCILERLFGEETIDDLEGIRGDLSIPDIIDGRDNEAQEDDETKMAEEADMDEYAEDETYSNQSRRASTSGYATTEVDATPSGVESFLMTPDMPTAPLSFHPSSAFANLKPVQNGFGATTSAFGQVNGSPVPQSAFGGPIFTASSQVSSVEAQRGPIFSQSLPAPSLAIKSVNPARAIQVSSAAQVDEPTLFSTIPSVPVPLAQASEPFSFPPSQMVPLVPHESKPPSTPGTTPVSDEVSLLATQPRPFPGIFGTPQNSWIGNPNPKLPTSPTITKVSANPSSAPMRPSPLSIMTVPPSAMDVSSQRSPPPLQRLPPVSLPATPILPLIPASPFPTPTTSKTHLSNLKIQTTLSAINGPLSPLVLETPSTNRPLTRTVESSNAILSIGSPMSVVDTGAERLPASPYGHTIINGKWRGRAPNESDNMHDDQDNKSRALSFCRSGCLVRNSFETWRARLMDRVAYAEACRRSEAYSNKVSRSKHPDLTLSDLKRRPLAPNLDASPTPKRLRRRLGSYRPHQTDDTIAQRLKENHGEQEQRWAQGSFLSITQQVISYSETGAHPGWRIWLSLNSENDGTAIWLQRKFDVPTSGEWESEDIFSIALSGDCFKSPGLILFECTPLVDASDLLERKYRILDDCARLRDLMDALPAKRLHIPSLLILTWAEEKLDSVPEDLGNMISKYVRDNLITGSATFFASGSANHTNLSLRKSLESLHLDRTGLLAHHMTLRATFQYFNTIWQDFHDDWLEKCQVDHSIDWLMYAKVLQSCVEVLNLISQQILRLCELPDMAPLPQFSEERQSESQVAIFSSVMSWLAIEPLHDFSHLIVNNLSAHHDLGRDFPALAFSSQLFNLAVSLLESQLHNNGEDSHYMLKSDFALAEESIHKAMDMEATRLQRLHILYSRRSPKRALSVDMSRSSTPSKRQRLSEASATSREESPSGSTHSNTIRTSSPPISETTDGTVSSVVTIAMLRSLTQDIKKKYGSIQ